MLDHSEMTKYLGFPLSVDEKWVHIFDADMREIGKVASMKQARLFVRGYRKAERDGS